jgi:HKD family nuclease
MTLFYNQPLAHRFGTELIQELTNSPWSVFEAAVAWARRSGMAHILPSLKTYLGAGGIVRITVGIDIQNTSREGLDDLLALIPFGQIEVYVYHDEAQTTFHPKIYLFRNDRRAKLIVGSNNLTESGLYINSEAGLEIMADLSDSAIQDAMAGLAAWRDPTDQLSLPLTQNLLDDLVLQGYVMPEAQLARPRRQPRKNRPADGTPAPLSLFGRTKVTRPPKPPRVAVLLVQPNANPDPVGRVLLMRVRKAHATTRPTQTQLPKQVYNEFFGNVASIRSSHDNRDHNVIEATARGTVNTLKLEIPEMRTFADPVVRFERTVTGVIYEAYDAASVLGKPVMAALRRGLAMSPAVTKMTKPRTPDTSTWWRFI